MSQNDNICAHCGQIIEYEICENCSLRCPICYEVVASFQDDGYYSCDGCEHMELICNTDRNNNDYIEWSEDVEDLDFESKFESFSDKYLRKDDFENSFDYRIETLAIFAKVEGLILIKHKDPKNANIENAICYRIIKKQ